ncbi:MAG: YncE family protein [Thermoplasmata archaeon]|jgi:DNA-binding beta-propeller fold protein YncE
MRSWLIRISAGLAFLIVLIVIAGASATSVHGTGSPVRFVTDALPATISTKTVTVGSGPENVLYDPANTEVYVGNINSNTVSYVSSTTYVVKTISPEKDPLILTYSASNKDVYVENGETKTISVISSATNKVTHTITLPGTVLTQVYDPANGDVYAESLTTTDVFELSDINHATFALKNVVLPSEAIFAAYDNASTSLVFPITGLNEVVAVSSTDVATTVKLKTGLSPEWMVYNPDDKDLYITDVGSPSSKTGNVSVLSSANTIVATIKVGKFPTFGSYDPSNHDIFEVNTGGVTKPYPTSTVSVIGTSNTVLTTITVGKYAVIASYDPKNSEMYVSCAASNKTYAISSTTNKIVGTITTTQYAGASEYDPALGDMLAAGISNFVNHSSTAKTIITVIPSSNTGPSTVTIGPGPLAGAAYDPKDSGFWGANNGDTVSIIL